VKWAAYFTGLLHRATSQAEAREMASPISQGSF